MESLKSLVINGETFYKISNVHLLRPFFMSIVSDSNHWLFVSSNGGISAGRKNAEFALFPYYTDDKITDTAETTGSKTLIRVLQNGKTVLWEPFSVRSEGHFSLVRNLYQNRFSNKIIFEEINQDLGLSFQYEWNSSNVFGFVRQARLKNLASQTQEITFIDGVQNVLPAGVPSDLQTKASNLVDAYKRTELVAETGLGLFALSAIIVDKAEPSEALKTNVVWSLGIEKPTYLLSALQLPNFRRGENVRQETDVKGEKGAYFVASQCTLEAGKEKTWSIIANVNQTHASVIALNEKIKSYKDLRNDILADIEAGTERLIALTASADALQYTADELKDTRHFSNVLFNVMRGGIIDHNYQIEKQDFSTYLQKANKQVFAEAQNALTALPTTFSLFELKNAVQTSANQDFKRLATEYLPLRFSRRHGDPSRPWNQFSINTNSEIDGSKILDYQGNWRDIFQNWEALAYSYPEFIEGMIYKFLNASTFDGYNPYRVTKDGFDWETVEPDNPWAYIGYWGDHQIIYLLKFLEFAEQKKGGAIEALLGRQDFVYANVPYQIKPYSEIVKNPKDTIVFDYENEHKIHAKVQEMGADGALLTNQTQAIHRVNFAEKILATLLSKLSNFVPEGGIWMNTQRPEWNDANNALVGNGLSMVTLYYLRRFLKFFEGVFQRAKAQNLEVSEEMHTFFTAITAVFVQYANALASPLDAQARKQITDKLGKVASDYRTNIYESGFSGKKANISTADVAKLVITALAYMEHSIKANKRKDNLYHAYNLLNYSEKGIEITYLSEMLEGQVGVLSSGYLSAEESVQVLDALRQSSLYRQDQNSYILYPNKNLKGFLQRNDIPTNLFVSSKLLMQLLMDSNNTIAEKDIKGGYHFNGNFKNADDLSHALEALAGKYQDLVKAEKTLVLNIFEEVFNHKEFTGRSGTFYGYEGLGSIYWHMVSKHLLAVQETCLRATHEGAGKETIDKLNVHFHQIFDGIGVHKSPEVYGAFPITPYSHTPFGKGAQQPGMTGQVKEDILSRFGELGIFIKEGKLYFEPTLLRKEEFLTAEKKVFFFDVQGNKHDMTVGKNALFFTICSVPVVYELADKEGIEVFEGNSPAKTYSQTCLPAEETENLFKRNGKITMIKVKIKM
ncbi:MAG: hypothetical protein EAZ95_07950 [Bacteroidetes bacterium]|nr:MAG: hypothetical protein EAZ95_07950 [Bacteroidota bacterium]